jgi:hypothetical protein
MRKHIDWLWPRHPSDLWNIVVAASSVFVALFTVALTVVAYEQYASDAASLTLTEVDFEQSSGFTTLPIENDGGRESGEIAGNLYYAYYDRVDHLKGFVYTTSINLPDLPAGQIPYKLMFDFPEWNSAQLSRIKANDATARIGIVLLFKPGWFLTKTVRLCTESVSIKQGTDMTWGPCDRARVAEMEREPQKVMFRGEPAAIHTSNALSQ